MIHFLFLTFSISGFLKVSLCRQDRIEFYILSSFLFRAFSPVIFNVITFGFMTTNLLFMFTFYLVLCIIIFLFHLFHLVFLVWTCWLYILFHFLYSLPLNSMRLRGAYLPQVRNPRLTVLCMQSALQTVTAFTDWTNGNHIPLEHKWEINGPCVSGLNALQTWVIQGSTLFYFYPFVPWFITVNPNLPVTAFPVMLEPFIPRSSQNTF